MKKNTIITLGVIMLLLLVILCLLCHTRGIENDIRIRAGSALADAGLPDSILTVDGRDVALHGYVENEAMKEKAASALANIPGIRIINNKLTIGGIIDKPGEPDINYSAEMIQSQIDKLISKTPLQFEFDSDQLRNPVTAILSEISDILEKAPYLPMTVTGHTDSRGTSQYNQGLSERRALRIKNELVKNGISEKRAITEGDGENKPLADNATKSGRQKNRRVEIKIKEGM